MSEPRKQIRLGLAGFGEVGSTLGRGLKQEGLETILSYDKYAFDGPFAALIQRRAREADVELVASAPALAARVDVIIGAPLQDGFRVPLIASGEAAPAFRGLMVPWGMNVTVVGDALGAASGIKILRSVLIKGFEALVVECALGCARYGIREDVFRS